MASMSKPSKPSETLGEDAILPTWSSEWLKRTPSCEPPDFPTTNILELCDMVGKQFKCKHPVKQLEPVRPAAVHIPSRYARLVLNNR
ncbi:hypothetical protein Ctob_014643 [Chrysochromulina tobinii]|uniref:Uncharacterized protein n=1 Tax=Chrysochromulina tobinii TaxID=1460289 RepID=A0A0M0K9F5_9EUKA|nr:hypothetical protein Ctob_014643 [Chrysochromulina tobinii]|eukprot:KOO35247.1 hypothetical protein Ctob_014643 [Chrysochromulina sp. CCMP291]